MTKEELLEEIERDFKEELIKEFPDGSVRWRRGIYAEDMLNILYKYKKEIK